ncbi:MULTISPECIES: MarR family winged helix-turn-helix transcriptional regulator [unclassified Vibrio]|uniref:MarR family transcriptional regulator n=1 Tax=Vibrio sp. HB236076 TaxID=3232307 RepID=A0AB39HK91_9VIBR|nr:MarR family transcriptional regulator [Vibrio sp. HB161653]MDP5253264.1 MarR family transcriptional regulator [Vibrio sp. HB161653]
MDVVDQVIAQWGAEKPQLNTLPMAVMGRLIRSVKHLETAINQVHKQYGLKPGEFDMLATLRRSGQPYQLTPSELMANMMLSSGAMTNRLDKLEQKGWIERVHCQQDRRSVQVKLTEQGITCIESVLEQHVKEQERLMAHMSVDEQQQLNHLLKALVNPYES